LFKNAEAETDEDEEDIPVAEVTPQRKRERNR
jgi:hypothetical protein